ncbi:MAG: HlyD family efflux transporter periplasmic adaptor subunit, partial [Deltaproteobacteria bacterium]|nr:HlyD family efflux transporter periplasmic adaptor subunit [Deltaproteobacteria bacterium]
LDRTVIRTPFDLVVREESIDLGSEILTSTPIATLAAIDLFWAEISVPAAKLAWFELPAQDRKGALVELYGREPQPYSGRIVALAPDLDKDGLMARLLIAVDDPLGLKNGRSPLLLGSFVRAVIKGATLDRVYRLPRSVLPENDILMLADSEDKLRFQPVEIVWRGLHEVFVGSGLQPEDRVIISKLAAPLDGMPLKVRPPRTATDNHEAGKVKEAGAAHDSTEKP